MLEGDTSDPAEMDGFRFVAKVRTFIHYRSLQTGNVPCRKNIWKSWGARDFNSHVGGGVARSVRIDHPEPVFEKTLAALPRELRQGTAQMAICSSRALNRSLCHVPSCPPSRCGAVWLTAVFIKQRRPFDGAIRLGSRRREQPASRRPVPEAAHPTRPLFVHSHRVREQGGRDVCPPGPPR
jgi:hypothetical protein